MDTIDIQKRIRRWVETRLGSKAMRVHERGMRQLEESIELAQSCGASREEALRLVKLVYSNPIGEPSQELGGAALTLLACADGLGYNLGDCAFTELVRIENAPPEKFRKRQLLNTLNGIGEPPEDL